MRLFKPRFFVRTLPTKRNIGKICPCHLAYCTVPSSTPSNKDENSNNTNPISHKPHVKLQWKQPEGIDKGIKVYNSLSRSTVPFIIPADRPITWYMCGPTVYDHSHLGHAVTYLRFDIMRRIMSNYFQLNLWLVLGITDVDDKIINKALRQKTTVKNIARKYEKSFFEDMRSLNVLSPMNVSRVSEFIPDIIAFIETLIKKGVAYEHEGNIFFDTAKHERYGKLYPELHLIKTRSHEDVTEKKNEKDFALWKAAPRPEKKKEVVVNVPGSHWDSPWGRGRPGWHIECSVMSSVLFGEHLDMHSGGKDLLYPHHENEIAQCEAYFGCDQWADYFVHSGTLNWNGNKMSKSSRNFVTISEFKEHYPVDVLRLLVLLFNHSSIINYSDSTLKEALSIHSRLTNFTSNTTFYLNLFSNIPSEYTNTVQDAPKRFSKAENEIKECYLETKDFVDKCFKNNFDTPSAVRQLMKLVHKLDLYVDSCYTMSKKTQLIGRQSLYPHSTVCSPNNTQQQQPLIPVGCFEIINECYIFVTHMFKLLGCTLNEDTQIKESETKLGSRIHNSIDKGQILDEFILFRNQIRQYSLKALRDIKKSQKENKIEERKTDEILKELLKVCDDLRDHAKSNLGITIKDDKDISTWRNT